VISAKKMKNEELDKIIHNKLLPLQQRFLSYEKLANGSFYFDGKHFSKAAESIQEVIDIVRDITTED